MITFNADTPLINQIRDQGLVHLIKEAREMVGIARIRSGTNDICIIVTIRETDTQYESELRACTREHTLETMQDCFPEATNTIGRLKKKLPPTEFHSVWLTENGYVVSMEVECLHATEGVLN